MSNKNFQLLLFKMTKIPNLFFLFFTWSGLAFGQSVGDSVANYTFRDVINNEPFDVSVSKNEKITILEFWATWCAPCLPAMEKLELIQKKYSDDIEILTISSDNRERLVKYIETTKTTLKIAFDTTHQEVFNYSTIPHTIIIGKDGIIKAITTPEQLTNNFIENLITNQKNNLKSIKQNGVKKIIVDTLCELQDLEKNVLTTFQPNFGSRSKNLYSDSGELRQIILTNMGFIVICRTQVHLQDYISVTVYHLRTFRICGKIFSV